MPPKQPPKKTPKKTQRQHPKPGPIHSHDDENPPINLSPLPLPLQQLLLNTFKASLLPKSISTTTTTEPDNENENEELNLKPLIQTIKTHLYNRDFASAFTDANEDVLRAYALRWSAGRALGYLGLLRGVLGLIPQRTGRGRGKGRGRVVCIGGGGGAEIGALGAVWRDVWERYHSRTTAGDAATSDSGVDSSSPPGMDMDILHTGLSITAVDIADWSSVISRLDSGLRSAAVQPGSGTCRAPLVGSRAGGGFEVGFRRADVLGLLDEELDGLFKDLPAESESESESPSASETILVTLMFTLNELFSTSMAKTTSFLLRMTDSLQAGTVLLVVDSPGSYSTLKLGKGGQEERRYPMKFLLDHTLLSVATGKWERVFSQDSRWWRRDAVKLRYDVGEGAGLEDMRYQIHVYRRIGSSNQR